MLGLITFDMLRIQHPSLIHLLLYRPPVKFTGAPVYAGTPVLLTVTDNEFNKTFKVTRVTGQGGILTFTEGCGSKGMSVTAECQYVLSPKSYYGTGSANLTSTNGFSGTIDINMN